MSTRVPTPETCPVCGTDVPRNARACPECGADERSCWNEDDTRYDGLDLPDEAYADEPAKRTSARSGGANTFWLIVAVVTLVALILVFIFR